MSDVMLMLVVSECQDAVKNCANGGFEDKLRAAMTAAKDHWMVLDKDTQFQGAVAAVLLHYGKDSEEGKRLVYEINAIRKISAILNAAQAGVSVNLHDVGDKEKCEPVGLMKMWWEIAK